METQISKGNEVINKKREPAVIKELESLEDFKKVYRVFSGPPYNEVYTDEELEEIYLEYKEKGHMYSVYCDKGAIRTNSIRKGNTTRTSSYI